VQCIERLWLFKINTIHVKKFWKPVNIASTKSCSSAGADPWWGHYLYAGSQTSGLLEVVKRIDIWYRVVVYVVNTRLPCIVSSNKTYANQLENSKYSPSSAWTTIANKLQNHNFRCKTIVHPSNHEQHKSSEKGVSNLLQYPQNLG
jgi:hypothetical protein